jgi:cytoskeleton protein RodZ
LTELTGIGAELRRARESQGLAVADVAQQLKFASRQIESLENERFDRLPGPTIARGMVRNYARLLNLDPEPLIERMAPKVEPAPDSAQLAARFKQPVPFSDNARRSTLVYAGFSLAVLALAAVVAYEWQQERATPQFVAPAQPQRPPEPEPLAAPATEPAPAAQAVAEAPKVEPKKPAETKPAEKKVVEKKAPEAAVAKPEAPTTPLRVATGNLHRIEFFCQEESWIEVTDGSGRSLVSSLNPAGCQRLVRGRGPFEIVVGNARGVTLTIDGKTVDLAQHTRGGEVARVTFE